MPLTDDERQQIYEEEKARRQVRSPMSPTDQLSNCLIWGCVLSIGVLILLGVIFMATIHR